MTDIEKFDPSQLMQGVRDRIKATFISLIPDDKWEELVQKEIDAFFAETKNNGYYRQNDKLPSPFSAVCNEVFQKRVADTFNECIQSSDWSRWSGLSRGEMSLKIEEFLKANSNEIMQGFFQKTLGQALASFTDQLQFTPRNPSY